MQRIMQNRPYRALRAAVLALALGLVMSIFASPARAIGFCENNPVRYSFLAISESLGAVALTVEHTWCEVIEHELEGPTEKSGVIKYVEIRDLATNTKIEYVAAPQNRAQARRIEKQIGAFTSVPKGKLIATLESRGFKTSQRKNQSPNKRCTVRRIAGSAKADDEHGGFPEFPIRVRVAAGNQRLLELPLTTAARERSDDVFVAGVFLPERKALAVWARAPQCDGPPPGYFGPDDPGECYQRDEPVSLLLTLEANPTLAPCFDSPPAAPTPVPGRY